MCNNKEKWYNDKMLLMQLIIIPPIFFHGLYHTSVISKEHKRIITVSFLFIIVAFVLYFVFR